MRHATKYRLKVIAFSCETDRSSTYPREVAVPENCAYGLYTRSPYNSATVAGTEILLHLEPTSRDTISKSPRRPLTVPTPHVDVYFCAARDEAALEACQAAERSPNVPHPGSARPNAAVLSLQQHILLPLPPRYEPQPRGLISAANGPASASLGLQDEAPEACPRALETIKAGGGSGPRPVGIFPQQGEAHEHA
jgi:hypothetical protein